MCFLIYFFPQLFACIFNFKIILFFLPCKWLHLVAGKKNHAKKKKIWCTQFLNENRKRNGKNIMQKKEWEEKKKQQRVARVEFHRIVEICNKTKLHRVMGPMNSTLSRKHINDEHKSPKQHTQKLRERNCRKNKILNTKGRLTRDGRLLNLFQNSCGKYDKVKRWLSTEMEGDNRRRRNSFWMINNVQKYRNARSNQSAAKKNVGQWFSSLGKCKNLFKSYVS